MNRTTATAVSTDGQARLNAAANGDIDVGASHRRRPRLGSPRTSTHDHLGACTRTDDDQDVLSAHEPDGPQPILD